MTQPVLSRLGRYRILRELGQGAMGVVYLAQDELLQRQVALKTMQLPDEPEERAHLEGRFRQEAKAAGGLNHPNIITVHDLGREGDWLYIAMELLHGEELRDLMTQGRLPLPLAVDIAAQVATGLAAAHQRGVIHRDIKPSNIMVLAGRRVKIMDFGVARMQSSDVKTQTGMMLGSPKYMSPEQVEGRGVDHRSDIFSLGAMLYEMIAGAAPFGGANLPALMYAIARDAPPAPSTLNAAIPPELDRIVAKAMAKQPEARHQDAGELALELERCAPALAAAPAVARTPVSVAAPNEDAGLRLSARIDPSAALRRWEQEGAGRQPAFAWIAAWALAGLAALWIAFG